MSILKIQPMPSNENSAEDPVFSTGYDPLNSARGFLIDITGFIGLLSPCFEAVGARYRKAALDKLLASKDWFIIFNNKHSGRCVYSESKAIEYNHELSTAKVLTQQHYDVLFAPKGMFKRADKRFDVFLIRDHVILKADLKSITSKNPDTIANRIKEGSQQASRVVLDILSNIESSSLIDALRSGVNRNNLIKEVLLLYKNHFYRLPKEEILSKKIYGLLSK